MGSAPATWARWSQIQLSLASARNFILLHCSILVFPFSDRIHSENIYASIEFIESLHSKGGRMETPAVVSLGWNHWYINNDDDLRFVSEIFPIVILSIDNVSKKFFVRTLTFFAGIVERNHLNVEEFSAVISISTLTIKQSNECSIIIIKTSHFRAFVVATTQTIIA